MNFKYKIIVGVVYFSCSLLNQFIYDKYIRKYIK